MADSIRLAIYGVAPPRGWYSHALRLFIHFPSICSRLPRIPLSSGVHGITAPPRQLYSRPLAQPPPAHASSSLASSPAQSVVWLGPLLFQTLQVSSGPFHQLKPHFSYSLAQFPASNSVSFALYARPHSLRASPRGSSSAHITFHQPDSKPRLIKAPNLTPLATPTPFPHSDLPRLAHAPPTPPPGWQASWSRPPPLSPPTSPQTRVPKF